MAGVSVIIPAFNAAVTLNKTIHSISRQIYRDWEAIIVDDGSTDFTASNAKVWCERDYRFRLIKIANRGASGARNEGASHATTPWLLFIDADDLILPNHLAKMLSAASQQPRPDLVYCAGARIASDGRIGTPEMAPSKDYFWQLTKCNLFYTHGCLVRRAFFDKVGGFDTRLITCEDWDLWQRFARAGAVFVPINECLALYRMNPNSLSHNVELLLQGARLVLNRGHGLDPRVEPVPEFAEGAPTHELGPSIIAHALWCFAVLVGQAKDGKDFLLRAELPSVEKVEVDRAISVIQAGVPAGACALQEDWPLFWPRLKDRIYEAFCIVEERCALPQFADSCISGLAARLNYLNSQRGDTALPLEIVSKQV